MVRHIWGIEQQTGTWWHKVLATSCIAVRRLDSQPRAMRQMKEKKVALRLLSLVAQCFALFHCSMLFRSSVKVKHPVTRWKLESTVAESNWPAANPFLASKEKCRHELAAHLAQARLQRLHRLLRGIQILDGLALALLGLVGEHVALGLLELQAWERMNNVAESGVDNGYAGTKRGTKQGYSRGTCTP